MKKRSLFKTYLLCLTIFYYPIFYYNETNELNDSTMNRKLFSSWVEVLLILIFNSWYLIIYYYKVAKNFKTIVSENNLNIKKFYFLPMIIQILICLGGIGYLFWFLDSLLVAFLDFTYLFLVIGSGLLFVLIAPIPVVLIVSYQNQIIDVNEQNKYEYQAYTISNDNVYA